MTPAARDVYVRTAVAVGIQWAAAGWAGEEEERQMAARVISGWATYASWLMQARAAGLLAWSGR